VSARIHPITDGTAGRVHAYLLEIDDGLTLIDTLSGDDGAVVLAELSRMGRSPGDLGRIVLTHAHRSHVRGAARLRELSGATVYANPFEATTIRGEAPCAPVTLWPRRPYRVLHLQYGLTVGSHLERLGVPRRLLDPFIAPACPVDVEVAHGDAIGSLQAVLTPGHTDGSTSFYWPQERALFTGDVLVTWPRLEIGWAGLTTDTARNRRSLSELATVGDVEWIGTGHGPPITEDAAARVRELLEGAASRRYSRDA
jgi:glyoxylase-like metal-dependent hydrolase (beta-lactamase superfamily II)